MKIPLFVGHALFLILTVVLLRTECLANPEALPPPAGAEIPRLTPAVFTAPEPGAPLQVQLGRNEQLFFVWIKALSMWVGKHEITNGQYNRFDMGHSPDPHFGRILDLPDQPVVRVSWEDANNYCNWLTRNYSNQIPAGFVFRLPGEQEWQTFAACGDNRRYPWGDTWPPPNTHNYRGEEGSGLIYHLFQNEKFIAGHNDGFIVSAPVQKSGANEWGLHGVGGNVWEWTQDWYDPSQTTKSLRGAGWNNYEPERIALTNRSSAHPARQNAMIGFRVVVAPSVPR